MVKLVFNHVNKLSKINNNLPHFASKVGAYLSLLAKLVLISPCLSLIESKARNVVLKRVKMKNFFILPLR